MEIPALYKERIIMSNYDIGWQMLDGKRFMIAKIRPALGTPEVVHKIESPGKSWQPSSFFTATTAMKDWIGTIRAFTKIEGKDTLLDVQGVYDGHMQIIKGIKLRTDTEPKIGQRVMVTEHVNVSGGFDMLATNRRILDLSNPNLNFVNIGWSSNKECRYLRIDPYSGECKECVGNPA